MSGKTGQVKRAPMQPGKDRQRMWQSMRVLRNFTVADLVATAEAPANSIRHYVHYLREAGYVRCVQAVQSGRTAGHARYALVRNTGPAAPRIGKRGVCDPNTEPQPVATMTIPRAEYERALRCIAVVQRLANFAPTTALRTEAMDALEVAR